MFKIQKILIILPAFNEEKNLKLIIQAIINANNNYDIIVINDCSKDNTSNLCRELGINVIDLPVNLGIGGAVQTGYKYAYNNGYDIAVQVDGDGQHNADNIQDLIYQINNNYDFCIGSRYINNEGFQSTLMRRIGIVYFSKLIKTVTGFVVTDPTSGFRACNKEVIKFFCNYYPQDYPEPETLVLLKKKQYRICEVPVIMNQRKEGKSSIFGLKSIYYMIKVTIAILISSFTINNVEDK